MSVTSTPPLQNTHKINQTLVIYPNVREPKPSDFPLRLDKRKSKSRNEIEQIGNEVGIVGVDSKVHSNVDSKGEKPCQKSEVPDNSQGLFYRCRMSPYAFHRFVRFMKNQTMRDGSVIIILRCRYCLELNQTIIRWVKKNGKYIAMKESMKLEEYESQNET